MQKSSFFVLLVPFFSASTVRAEFYHCVDKEGKDFYTNDMEKIPQEYRSGGVFDETLREPRQRGGQVLSIGETICKY